MSVGVKGWRRYVPSPAVLASIVVVLVAWQLLSMVLPGYQFPDLQHLVDALIQVLTYQTRYDPVSNIGMTLLRIVLSFVLVMVLGTATGVYMGLSKVTEDYLSTFVVVLLTVPSVIWAFLAVIWFGLRELLVPLFVIGILIYPYVTVNMWEGTKDIDPDLFEMAEAFGAHRSQVWRDIIIPHLTPYTFSTMRIAFTLCWKLALVAEIFGASTGVGVVIHTYYQNFSTDMIIAWALPIMFLMLVVEQVFQYLERRSYRWQPNAEVDSTDIEAVE
ncbi:MAG: ABC transporter permease [Salinigranum sp.]